MSKFLIDLLAVLKAVATKGTTFKDVTPCSLVEYHRRSSIFKQETITNILLLLFWLIFRPLLQNVDEIPPDYTVTARSSQSPF
jgi:hypothetical protein